MNKYPYRYEDSEQSEYVAISPFAIDDYVWHNNSFNLQHQLDQLGQLPIIEIGGPSVNGYYFLNEIDLPTKPIISNVRTDTMSSHAYANKIKEQIEQVVDGRHMPFEDKSVGTILMSAMSRTDDWYAYLSEQEQNDQNNIEKEKIELILAEQEEELAALGILDHKDAKHSQRVQIYHEVNRVLVDGGIYIGNGALSDVQALVVLGYKLVAILQRYQPIHEELGSAQGYIGYDYEFIIQKDSKN